MKISDSNELLISSQNKLIRLRMASIKLQCLLEGPSDLGAPVEILKNIRTLDGQFARPSCNTYLSHSNVNLNHMCPQICVKSM